ncbi:MAG: HAD family hydrolase [Thermomicrobiales bacterium]
MNSPAPRPHQHLLIDADDTLWENNIYFEQAFEDFVSFLNHEHLSGAEIQEIMDTLALANRGALGYGARAFARILRDTFRSITGVDESDPDLEIVERLGLRILDQHFETIDGVVETVTALKPHHDLILVTKGHEEEQRAKVERSGLQHFFNAIVVVEEKNDGSYRSTVKTFDLDPASTWMIGNSPKSDINPAIRAGINAIFIPHPRTWNLEVELIEDLIDPARELLHLASFRQLTSVFAATLTDPGDLMRKSRI